jgi:hypothetical protein
VRAHREKFGKSRAGCRPERLDVTLAPSRMARAHNLPIEAQGRKEPLTSLALFVRGQECARCPKCLRCSHRQIPKGLRKHPASVPGSIATRRQRAEFFLVIGYRQSRHWGRQGVYVDGIRRAVQALNRGWVAAHRPRRLRMGLRSRYALTQRSAEHSEKQQPDARDQHPFANGTDRLTLGSLGKE